MTLIRTFMIFTMVAFFSTAAMAGEEAPLTIDGTTFVDNAAAKALFDEGAAFVDAREDAAWNLGRIPGAIHLDVKTDAFTKEALIAEDATPDTKVVMYCNGIKCGRSGDACKKALGWGYKHVYYYREGFPGWKASGYPVE